MDTKLKPKRTVSFKIFLVPVPFPLVTTFETVGTYKKWLWPNSAHIMYTWHALILWHTYLHTYIYIRTAPARICTSLIGSRPICSLANKRIPITNLVLQLIQKPYLIWMRLVCPFVHVHLKLLQEKVKKRSVPNLRAEISSHYFGMW